MSSEKKDVILEKFWSGKEPKEYDTADEGFWDSGNQKETNDDALLQFFDNG